MGRILGGIQRTWHAQYGVEIGVCREAKFSRGRSESGDVASHQVAVQSQGFARSALEAQRNFDVPASDFLLQYSAQLHLQGIGARRQAEVQVEKTVVDGLQREREPGAAVALFETRGLG